MTQAEEAMEPMSCERCGQFAGAERLCAACDDAESLERAVDMMLHEDMNVPIEAVLAELLHERLFVRWLERQPGRIFYYAEGALTPLGQYLAEEGNRPVTELHGLVKPADAPWIRILEGVVATHDVYTAQELIAILRAGQP